MPDLRKYKEFLKKNKYLFVVLAVGIVLLLIPTGGIATNEKTTPEALDFSIDECESKLEKILSECAGVGRVKVALAVSGTAESVYAVEVSESSQRQESEYNINSDKKPSIISVGSGSQEPVTIMQMYPEFIGATVVCDGAESSGVRMDVTDAVASLTGLTSDKITVIKMKK